METLLSCREEFQKVLKSKYKNVKMKKKEEDEGGGGWSSSNGVAGIVEWGGCGSDGGVEWVEMEDRVIENRV